MANKKKDVFSKLHFRLSSFINFFQRTFFKRIILCYLASLCIFFVIFCVLITITINNNYKDEMVRLNEDNLRQSDAIANLVLGDIVNYTFNQYTSNADLIYLMYSDEYTDASSIKSKNVMNELSSNSSLVNSYYIVNYRAGYIVSNNNPMKSLEEFYDQQVLELLSAHTPSSTPVLLLPRSYTLASDSSSVQYVSIIYHSSQQGALIVNIELSALESLLNSSTATKLTDTYVINKYGQVVCSPTEQLVGTDYTNNEVWLAVLEHEAASGTFNLKLDEGNFYISYLRNASSGLTFIKTTHNYLFDTTNSLLVKALLYSVAFLVAGLLISFILSMLIYKPIDALHSAVNFYMPSSPNKKDEIEYISSSYIKIHEQNQSLQKSVWTYKNASRSKLVRHLLDTGFSSLSPIRGNEEIDELNLDGPNYLAIYAGIDSVEVNHDDLPIFLFAISNVFDEKFNDYALIEHAEISSSQLVFILNLNEYDRSIIISRIKETQELLQQHFKITFSCGIGTLVTELESVNASYHDAIAAYNNRFVIGPNSITLFADLQIAEAADQQYPYLLDKEIISTIKALQLNAFKAHLEVFINTISKYSYSRMIVYLLQFNLSLSQLELQYQIENIGDEFTLSSLQSSYLAEIKQNFTERGEKLILVLTEIRNNKSESASVIQKTIELVDENIYDSNLSVEFLAQEVHLSVNYLRNIFKKNVGISLSNYIIEKKIKLICELLIESNMTIQEISDRLGFTTHNYFYTFFKKHTGSTPSQYRKDHQTINE